MNKYTILFLRCLRKLYTKCFGYYKFPTLPIEKDLDKASDIIYNLLVSGKPCMISRFGANELNIVNNYISISTSERNFLAFIKAKIPEWWWIRSVMDSMQACAGFFPANEESLIRFSQLILVDAKEMDICGVFKTIEYPMHHILPYLNNPQFVSLAAYENTTATEPWTRVLKDKKVLVVHPFAKLIEKQYLEKRTLLFDNPDSLPEFQLQTIPAVQSLGGVSNKFKDWFGALQWMKDEIDKRDYDICLLGCGAYGFPLAAHVKRNGKQAVHIGGGLQLFFGIKGKRWEEGDATQWGLPHDFYKKLFNNENWVRPDEYVSSFTKAVENGCYW